MNCSTLGLAMRSHVTTYGTVKLDARGRIAHEVTCVSCGYDLRGLPPAGDCPECGVAIHAALSWRPGPRAWRRSAVLVSVSAVATVLTLVCHHLYCFYHATRSGPVELFHTLAGVCSLVVFVACVAAFVHVLRSRTLGALAGFVISLGLLFLSSHVTLAS